MPGNAHADNEASKATATAVRVWKAFMAFDGGWRTGQVYAAESMDLAPRVAQRT
jgi:hypothetical protein